MICSMPGRDSKVFRSPQRRSLRSALSPCIAGLLTLGLLACGGGEVEPADPSARAPQVRVGPAEVQRRIAAIAPPLAGELRFAQSGDASRVVRRSPRSGIVYLLGSPLDEQIGYAYGVPSAQLATSMSLELQRRYDAVIHPADRSVETARSMLREHLEARFGFEAAAGQREVEAMILRQMPKFSPLPPSTAETSSFEVKPGELRAVAVPMSRLVEFLRQGARLPWLDESGLDERYDFVIQWDTRSGAYAFVQAVNDLGLEVVNEARSVQVLELRPAVAPARASVAGAVGGGGSAEQARVR
jgi:uncharacterized protein (TIGR03435 family)